MFDVKVYFDNIGNYHLDRLIGQIRRLADEFGRPGITGKRGQKNNLVKKQGYLKIRWPNRRLAKAYQAAVDEFWGDRVTTRRFRTND